MKWGGGGEGGWSQRAVAMRRNARFPLSRRGSYVGREGVGNEGDEKAAPSLAVGGGGREARGMLGNAREWRLDCWPLSLCLSVEAAR